MNNKDNVKRFHLKYTLKLIYFDFQRENIFFSHICFIILFFIK